MTFHLSQIFLTDARTFIPAPLFRSPLRSEASDARSFAPDSLPGTHRNALLVPNFLPAKAPKATLAGRSLIPVDDSPTRQIVGRELDGHLIARKNANKIFAHLARNMRQHLVLIVQLHPKHRVRQRLDHRGHHLDGVFLRIAGIRVLLFWLRGLRHTLQFYQDAPTASRGRVRIQGPFEVTATVCSKCAEQLPSMVTAVHLSSRTLTPGPPALTIGSMAKTMPSSRRGPCPGSP